MIMNKLTIVVAQINLLVGDINNNTQRIIREARQAKQQQDADIVLFPELAVCGYPPEDLLLRPGFYRRCQEALETIVDAAIDTVLVVGYPETDGTHYYNRLAVIDRGKIIATYTKQALPNYTVFDEMRYFTPGDQPCVVKINGIQVGFVICEDLWHADAANQSAKAGAQILLSPNASPYDRNKVRSREMTLTQRVTETGVPIVYANLVGGQDELVFDGGSMVINADGERCQQAAYFKEDHMVVEVIGKKALQILSQPLPKRFSEEETIYQALVLGVRDYIEKNHFPGAVLGLSGGIDSALTLAIAVDALGADRVQTLMMPTRYTADMSVDDAQQQAEIMGVQHRVIAIEKIFSQFLSDLAPIFNDLPVDTTEENLQARIRGMLLMAVSNKTGSIVLTTGNKSEMSVGYATLYGDMAGGFCVLKDIPKTLVYRLAKYRNQRELVIPERVIEREPSAELRDNQKDQDSLPPYPVLDEILRLYIEEDADPVNICAAGLDKATVEKVVQLVDRNEYKRRQAPIGIRTTERAFGKDRRYPITSGYSRNLWNKA